jgi:sulfite reductase alpha subunit-like flavoprotein
VAFPYSFSAGDVVLIQPSNSAIHVQQFCQVLGLDPNQWFVLQAREPGECGSQASPWDWLPAELSNI